MSRLLARVASGCARWAWAVSAVALVAALAGGVVAQQQLGLTTDTDALFSQRLPWVRDQAALKRVFPQGDDLLVAVVDGVIPEEADATAAALAEALSRDTAHFVDAHDPEASPYFARNGLMFIATGQLESLLNQTIDAQPFLGKLAADPSLAGLVGALGLIAEGIKRGQADLTPFVPAMTSFHLALAADGGQPLSWETLLAGPLVEMGGRYRFVLARPKLESGAMRPGAAAAAAVREAAGRLEFVQSGRARVRLTGAVALQDDEFAAVARGAEFGLAGSVALILLWLFLAVRTWRLMLPIVLTLALGLDLTTAFATLAIGSLNLVSVAYAILFVGLAVDFAIQFTVRFREVGGARSGVAAALGETARRSGGQILVAALATAAGFLAFTPTAFTGVAQLGLIAGVGMLIAFGCTATALPAFIALFGPRAEGRQAGVVWARPLDGLVVRRRRPLLAVAGLVALAGVAVLPWLPFDGDPLHAKTGSTESMQTLDDLSADPLTSPYRIELLQPTVAAAAAAAARLNGLSSVQGVLSIDSLVPEDQTPKLALIADAAMILGPTLNATPAPHPSPALMRAAVREAAGPMRDAAKLLPAGHPFAAIADDLARLADAPDEQLVQADRALTRFLPLQLSRLRDVLQAGPVSRADIPPDLAQDWLAADGEAKLQVMLKRGAAHDTAGLRRFVTDVTGVVPNAGGAAVSIVRSGDAIVGAFREAMLVALVAIAAILLVAFRRVLDAALVLAPLVLSGLVSGLALVGLGMPLSLANIVALPLLLGVGVAFNVYYVMNWRAGMVRPLSSATTRAVLFSALTTATAFGALALSGHAATASLGRLLVTGLACALVVTLVVLPALLAVGWRGRVARA